MEIIETFLKTIPEAINAKEHVLFLHEKFRDPLGYTETKYRYRDFLVCLDSDLKEDFMFVTSIDGMIDQLRVSKSNNQQFFTQKQYDLLKFLQKNRFYN